jgi:hypothetical protein
MKYFSIAVYIFTAIDEKFQSKAGKDAAVSRHEW